MSVRLALVEGEPQRRTIAFTDRAVVAWTQALREGTVDTGTGCFAHAAFDPADLQVQLLELFDRSFLQPAMLVTDSCETFSENPRL